MRNARLRVASASSSDLPDAKQRRGDVSDETKAAIGKRLREYLLRKWCFGEFTPLDVCTLSFFHTQTGGTKVEDLSLDPLLRGRNQGRVMREALKLDEVVFKVYMVKIAVWDDETCSRSYVDFPVRLPHEVITHDATCHPQKYEHGDQDDVMVDAFLKHANTVRWGYKNCKPVGYYTDKVALGKYRSFVRGSCGVTFVRQRLTCWILQTSKLCKCGCNGACTIAPIQVVMNASLNCLQKKEHMHARFDSRPWLPNDRDRQAAAGSPLHIRGSVNEYRADLPERCAQAGMKSHSADMGCMVCHCSGEQAHTRTSEVTFDHFPFRLRTHENYLEELALQLIRVDIASVAEQAGLLTALEMKQQYPWGRRVKGKLGLRYRLRAADLLILGGDVLRDVHQLEELDPPFTAFFFQNKKRHGLRGGFAHVQYTWSS